MAFWKVSRGFGGLAPPSEDFFQTYFCHFKTLDLCEKVQQNDNFYANAKSAKGQRTVNPGLPSFQN